MGAIVASFIGILLLGAGIPLIFYGTPKKDQEGCAHWVGTTPVQDTSLVIGGVASVIGIMMTTIGLPLGVDHMWETQWKPGAGIVKTEVPSKDTEEAPKEE